MSKRPRVEQWLEHVHRRHGQGGAGAGGGTPSPATPPTGTVNMPAENVPAPRAQTVNMPAENVPAPRAQTVNMPAENVPVPRAQTVNMPAENVPAPRAPTYTKATTKAPAPPTQTVDMEPVAVRGNAPGPAVNNLAGGASGGRVNPPSTGNTPAAGNPAPAAGSLAPGKFKVSVSKQFTLARDKRLGSLLTLRELKAQVQAELELTWNASSNQAI